ncbi:hypothetical protein OROGR_008659 [Orobanche gracilis]
MASSTPPPPRKDEAYLSAVIQKRIDSFDKIKTEQTLQRLSLSGDRIRITLPDGIVKEGQKWITTPLCVAAQISVSLASSALISKVNGHLWDMGRPLEGDCDLKLYTFDSDEGRDTFWHSSAHILGQALEMEYGCKLCIGPCTTRGEGFYYDAFYGELSLNEDHFKQIEAEVAKAVAEKQPFERIEVTKQQAIDLFSDNRFKVEIINDLPEDKAVTVYRCGRLVDLCCGPHLPNTSFVKAMCCLKVPHQQDTGEGTKIVKACRGCMLYPTLMHNKYLAQSLPLDVITSILSRLPVKSVLRFKCVSKTWCSLIESSDFVNLHLSQTRLSMDFPKLVVSQYLDASFLSATIYAGNHPNNCYYFTELADHPLKQLRQPKIRIIPQILGSCNGILCLSVFDKSSVFLYNPSTRTHHLIPQFSPTPNSNPVLSIDPSTINMVVFGLGFYSVQRDYRVVRLVETVSCNPWTLLYREASNNSGAFVREKIYFVYHGKGAPPQRNVIKCFDIHTISFSSLRLPEVCDRCNGSYILREFEGSLSLIGNFGYHDPLVPADCSLFWTLSNDNFWTMVFNIGPGSPLRSALLFSKAKDQVLLDTGFPGYVWFGLNYSCHSVQSRGLVRMQALDSCDDTWMYVDNVLHLSKEKQKIKAGLTEIVTDDRVPTELENAIKQTRMDKKLTLSQLAQDINETPEVIKEYESGKAIPNQQMIEKLEHALGVKLLGEM